MWLFGGVMLLLVAALVRGWPTHWIGPVVAFSCAEITRRVMAEANPAMPSRWVDIFRFSWDVSRGRAHRYEFCGPPAPTPAQRRAQLRLVTHCGRETDRDMEN